MYEYLGKGILNYRKPELSIDMNFNKVVADLIDILII